MMKARLVAGLLLGASYVCVLPPSAEAQRVEAATLEDGRFEAIFNSAGDEHRYSGVAWVDLSGTLWLCPEEASPRPNRPGSISATLGEAGVGEYALGIGEGVDLVTRNLPAPPGLRSPGTLRQGSYMTITVATEQSVAGRFEALYRDGTMAAQFRATVGDAPAGFHLLCRQTPR